MVSPKRILAKISVLSSRIEDLKLQKIGYIIRKRNQMEVARAFTTVPVRLLRKKKQNAVASRGLSSPMGLKDFRMFFILKRVHAPVVDVFIVFVGRYVSNFCLLWFSG